MGANLYTKRMVLEKPTPKQQKVLDLLSDLSLWRPPAIHDLQKRLKLKSDGFVIHCLKELVRKGYVRIENDGGLPEYVPIPPNEL